MKQTIIILKLQWNFVKREHTFEHKVNTRVDLGISPIQLAHSANSVISLDIPMGDIMIAYSMIRKNFQ